ncbi:MAG: hypothetical protein DKM50_10190 [Candidatus Margulisiibacteriota bacterium]|nr:MAG: hypothetical protein A2X43_04275 [Candidatus Margulisbacteria bacterium GWD2_39_127]OGI05215.1 MAG: hypothetical protein A2X42_02785 [Candidatus Margulisbacteria bacterium GWF2_38_17]OGI06264.1 MAG: hypothetical protein A2X41_08365 [Candidatus Margulisbacteria bacterium GWE2_39_32]PZM78921.1 MAG: hypothetical protein DKM50_10190 [Candidatus Margulisiibacteriota bacterium]HAR64495.1 hypothetical protein [Candidatus Margulisiibacteriota bacterium]
MNILERIKKDHDTAKNIMAELSITNEETIKSRTDLFTTLKNDLILHIKAEEDILYNPLKKEKEAAERMLESIEEHHIIELLLNELKSRPKSEERWLPQLRVLREIVENHIRTEEEEVFDLAREILSKNQLEEMGNIFETNKRETRGRMKMAA